MAQDRDKVTARTHRLTHEEVDEVEEEVVEDVEGEREEKI